MGAKQAVHVLELLEFFGRIRRPATLAEIARGLGWPRSSTFNLLKTLTERGYLYEPQERGGVYPTTRWLAVAREVSEVVPLSEGVIALMASLAEATGETVYVAGPAGTSVVTLDAVESPATIRYVTQVGKRIPIHTTAAGRAVLSQYPARERARLLASVKFERYQPSSLMSIESVEREIDASMERGYFQSLTEYTPDVVGIAVALPLDGWRMALSIAGPTFRTWQRLAELGNTAREAADRFLAARKR